MKLSYLFDLISYMIEIYRINIVRICKAEFFENE